MKRHPRGLTPETAYVVTATHLEDGHKLWLYGAVWCAREREAEWFRTADDARISLAGAEPTTFVGEEMFSAPKIDLLINQQISPNNP
jgi:hypothetical protein